ncbi:MAG: hypothetical protein WCO78_05580 [Candidatus Roizmanbacteria bacterium]
MWPTKITPSTPARERIHYTLAYGSLDDLRSLNQQYTNDEIKRTFQQPYRGIYSKAKFGFYRAYFGLFDLKSDLYLKHV